MTQTEKNPDRGNFVQFPCHLIYTCSDLTRDDKWVLLAIMGVCWTEGPYRLSYRDIAALAGVAPSLLSSIPEKNGKAAKEGIMARLQRLDYIRCVLAKDVHVATGKAKGNAQTYIYVNHTKIWGENAGYKVAPHSTRENLQLVLHTNRCVLHTNAPVLDENKPVLHTNAPVLDASTKTPPYITTDNSDYSDEKEIRSDVAANASDITSAPSFSSEEKPDPREETPPQQTKTHPIATTPVQPTQDMLLPEASHPLSEDEWLTLRGRFEQQVHARWKECQPKQGIRAAHATFAAFKKMEMRAWDLRTPKPQKNVTDALWVQLTPPEQEHVHRWFSLRKGAVITPVDVAGAQLFTMSGLDFTAEQMLKERDWLRDTQPNWFGFEGTKRGKVTLKDIAENAAAWLEANEQQTKQAPCAKIIEITTGHASNRYAQASLPGGKPSWMMTDEEIDALPTPLERKAARISKKNRLEFDRQQQEQSAPFAIAR